LQNTGTAAWQQILRSAPPASKNKKPGELIYGVDNVPPPLTILFMGTRTGVSIEAHFRRRIACLSTLALLNCLRTQPAPPCLNPWRPSPAITIGAFRNGFHTIRREGLANPDWIRLDRRYIDRRASVINDFNTLN